jgi:PAS domain S-box-containing protein
LTISPIKDPSGKLCGVSTIARDITQRRQAQRGLEKSEQRYRLLFDNNPQPMWVYDCETLAFLAVNNAAIRSYGYTREEFLGMTINDIRPAEDIPALLEDIRKANTALHTDGPWRHKKKDGTILVVEISVHPIKFGDRDARLAMVTDITERKKLEEQFQQAQRLESIGRLAGGVAHDFNNLLIVINGYSQMLLDGLSEDHPMREGLTQIGEAGARAGALTQQLLAFSRKQVLKPIVLNLNQAVADIKTMLQRLIGEDIDLVTRLLPELGNTLADAGQLQQVIMNLAVNARDALPNGGTLLIETASVTFDGPYCEEHPDVRPGPYVMLGVTDNGTGMTPEVRGRLFEPFFTTKPQGAGTVGVAHCLWDRQTKQWLDLGVQRSRARHNVQDPPSAGRCAPSRCSSSVEKRVAWQRNHPSRGRPTRGPGVRSGRAATLRIHRLQRRQRR